MENLRGKGEESQGALPSVQNPVSQEKGMHGGFPSFGLCGNVCGAWNVEGTPSLVCKYTCRWEDNSMNEDGRIGVKWLC